LFEPRGMIIWKWRSQSFQVSRINLEKLMLWLNHLQFYVMISIKFFLCTFEHHEWVDAEMKYVVMKLML